MRAVRFTLALTLVGGLSFPLPASRFPQEQGAGSRGKQLYDKWCAGCHGETGLGDGPAAYFMLARPRDFTPALYQIRTTASGQIPTDDDLMRVIDRGMPGTAMPGWSSILSRADRRDLVAYLKSFSRFFATEAPEVVKPTKAPRVSAEGIEEGRRLYQEVECWKCHGNAGRGNGPSAPTLRDDDDFPIAAANLTANWRFNGGGSAEDIYLRMLTGLDGTPMPSTQDLIESGIVKAEQLWRVAQYVRSLSPNQPPRVEEVIRARQVAAPVPTHPDDSVWAGVEEFYIPLVGQIVRAPRWFAPRVDGVFVSAVHDGERLALRLRWHDPSESPDEAWAEWRGAVARTMTDADGVLDSLPRPDGIVVQFPPAVPDGVERPHFLMGDRQRPVYLWRWQRAPRLAEEGRATGLETFAALPGVGSRLAHQSVFDNGEWRLVLSRALATADSASVLQFVAGRPIPVALFAWDGDNVEGGSRLAISTWYSLVLEEPTSAGVYVTPLVAAMVTAVLGWAIVRQAQRRDRRPASPVYSSRTLAP